MNDEVRPAGGFREVVEGGNLEVRVGELERALAQRSIEAGLALGLKIRVDALWEAMAKQNEINANDVLVGQTLQDMLNTLKERLDQQAREFAAHDKRIRMWGERWSGTVQRIERTQGTIEDVLKRFEGWKMIGNDMQEQLTDVSQRVDDQHAVLDIHTRMFDEQVLANEQLLGMMDRVRTALGELETTISRSAPSIVP